MNPRDVVSADVYKGATRIGTLERTSHGARFSYLPEHASAHLDEPGHAASFRLPPRAEPYEVFGTNLHPFFAGLLPEGLRLRALVRVLKTSEDDLFSLLAASGGDTVGDVYVTEPGEPAREHAPVADVRDLGAVTFDELLERSLRFDRERSDATVAGVQPKVSAAMISLPVRSASKRRAYILKPTPIDYPRLAENEAFFMQLAQRCGLPSARTSLVHDATGRSGLLVERFDRVPDGSGGLTRLHQEDACQLLDRYPADKYRLTLADVAGALEVCSAPLPERLKLLRLQAFSYLIANGDLHAKNVSVQVVDGRVALTPVYDLLSTLPYGDRRMALGMEGRDDNLKAADFVHFGQRVGLRPAAVQQMLRALCDKVARCLPRLAVIGLPAAKIDHLSQVMTERLAHLS